MVEKKDKTTIDLRDSKALDDLKAELPKDATTEEGYETAKEVSAENTKRVIKNKGDEVKKEGKKSLEKAKKTKNKNTKIPDPDTKINEIAEEVDKTVADSEKKLDAEAIIEQIEKDKAGLSLEQEKERQKNLGYSRYRAPKAKVKQEQRPDNTKIREVTGEITEQEKIVADTEKKMQANALLITQKKAELEALGFNTEIEAENRLADKESGVEEKLEKAQDENDWEKFDKLLATVKSLGNKNHWDKTKEKSQARPEPISIKSKDGKGGKDTKPLNPEDDAMKPETGRVEKGEETKKNPAVEIETKEVEAGLKEKVDQARKEYLQLKKENKPKRRMLGLRGPNKEEQANYENELQEKEQAYRDTRIAYANETLKKEGSEKMKTFLLSEKELIAQDNLENGPWTDKVKNRVSDTIKWWESVGNNPEDGWWARNSKRTLKTAANIAMIGGSAAVIVTLLASTGVVSATALGTAGVLSFAGNRVLSGTAMAKVMSVVPAHMQPKVGLLLSGILGAPAALAGAPAALIAGGVGLGASYLMKGATKKHYSEDAIVKKEKEMSTAVDDKYKLTDKDKALTAEELVGIEDNIEAQRKMRRKKEGMRRGLALATSLTISTLTLAGMGAYMDSHAAEEPAVDTDKKGDEPKTNEPKKVEVNPNAVVKGRLGISHAELAQTDADSKLAADIAKQIGFEGKTHHNPEFAKAMTEYFNHRDDASGQEIRIAGDGGDVAYQFRRLDNGTIVEDEIKMTDSTHGTLIETHTKGGIERDIEDGEPGDKGKYEYNDGKAHHYESHSGPAITALDDNAQVKVEGGGTTDGDPQGVVINKIDGLIGGNTENLNTYADTHFSKNKSWDTVQNLTGNEGYQFMKDGANKQLSLEEQEIYNDIIGEINTSKNLSSEIRTITGSPFTLENLQSGKVTLEELYNSNHRVNEQAEALNVANDKQVLEPKAPSLDDEAPSENSEYFEEVKAKADEYGYNLNNEEIKNAINLNNNNLDKLFPKSSDWEKAIKDHPNAQYYTKVHQGMSPDQQALVGHVQQITKITGVEPIDSSLEHESIDDFFLRGTLKAEEIGRSDNIKIEYRESVVETSTGNTLEEAKGLLVEAREQEQEAREAIKNAKHDLKDANRDLKQANDHLKEASEDLEKATDRLAKANKAADNLNENKTINKTTDAIGKVTAIQKDVAEAKQEVADAKEKLAEASDNTKKAIQQEKFAENNSKTAMKIVERETQRMQAEQLAAQRAHDAAEKEAEGTRDSVKSGAKRVKN